MKKRVNNTYFSVFFLSMIFHWLFNEISITHLWKKLTQEVHKEKWSSHRKFILEGDEVIPNNEPDEQGDETKDWITTVAHDPEDKQADGKWDTEESTSERDKMGRTLWQE